MTRAQRGRRGDTARVALALGGTVAVRAIPNAGHVYVQPGIGKVTVVGMARRHDAAVMAEDGRVFLVPEEFTRSGTGQA